ncbi:hypothetical protein BH23CHL10_BH23CHL10_16340 [soil metagenome]
MRTTIRLDDELLAKAKAHAASSGRTLAGVVEDALRSSLTRRDADPRPRSVKLPTFAGGSPRAGVDLDDSSALLDLMDSDDG